MPDHNLPGLGSPAVTAGRPARRRGRWLLVLLALAALGAAVFLRGEIAALLHRPAPPAAPVVAAEPPPALTVAVAAATPRTLARTVVGDGSVVAWQELVIGAEAGGLRVAEVRVEEGDAVRAGQLLVRMDETLLRAVLGQAEAAVAEAQAALRNARQDLARAADLSRTGNAPRQTLELRQAAAEQAEARVASAVARREEVAARLAQARIVAPADGVVSKRSVLPGNVTSAGQEMLRLIRDNRLELDARVPELELAALRPGQPVQVTHGDRAVTGEVRAIAPTVSADTRLGIVHVALPADSGLRPGMFARAAVSPGEAPGLTVPPSAILFRDGRPAVLAVTGDRVALRPVSTGRRSEDAVEITDGLAEGERVVVSGAGFLSDGDRVRLLDR
ncbi:efflux RND transporter periplasmic adaptor subunit [Roseomonas sp. BN140053]|uniref:efflux RND transporter periplasmic adaptor subunit n=1 Tax=Roseomonas sp. BN140053 TaxID=3391898 RepID=UPI0039ED8DCC